MKAGQAEERVVGAGLCVASFLLLSYQVTQVRVFAYSLNPVLVYSAISITMLGFGASSTALALSSWWRERPLRPMLAAACLALSVSGVVANLVFAGASPGMAHHADIVGSVSVVVLIVVLLCTLPYAFGGLLTALVLSRRTEGAGRLYFLNLLGSGAGCFAVTFLLQPLGAERLVIGLMALAAGLGAWFAGEQAPGLRRASAAVACLLALCLPWAPRLLVFKPDATDQHAVVSAAYRKAGAGEPVREFASWDPVARVEIHSWPGQVANFPAPVRFKFLTQDGGAGSLLLAVSEDPLGGANMFNGSATGLPFNLRRGGNALIIGVGGTGDVQAALHFGARRVTAVEINASTVRAMKTTFAEFLGRSLLQPNVTPIVGDGRSFVRRSAERYDVISIPGVDTLTLQSSGSFVFAEEYLYTEQAFVDYLGALSDDGLLAVLRFAHEPMRLSLMGAKALRTLGVERPDQHIVVLDQGSLKLTLVKRSPWTQDELASLDRILAEGPSRLEGVALLAMSTFFHYQPMRYLYAPHRPDADPIYGGLMRGAAAGRFPPIALPTDDRPYYFSAEWVEYFRGKAQPGPVKAVLDGYVRFMGLVIALALGAIFLPAALLRRGSGGGWGRSSAVLLYFFALGFCFMFLEIGLIQKTTIAVEHPAYSIAVVLASLLVASSLGSLASERLGLSLRRNVAVAAAMIAVLGVGYSLGLDAIFGALLGLPFALRMVGVALVIAPLGGALGMLFPTGLRALQGAGGQQLIPWAIAANGLASVVGSVLSLPFAVMFGFSSLLLAGAGLYLLGCLAFPFLEGPGDPGEGDPSGDEPGEDEPQSARLRFVTRVGVRGVWRYRRLKPAGRRAPRVSPRELRVRNRAPETDESGTSVAGAAIVDSTEAQGHSSITKRRIVLSEHEAAHRSL